MAPSGRNWAPLTKAITDEAGQAQICFLPAALNKVQARGEQGAECKSDRGERAVIGVVEDMQVFVPQKAWYATTTQKHPIPPGIGLIEQLTPKNRSLGQNCPTLLCWPCRPGGGDGPVSRD